MCSFCFSFFFFQAEDGIRDAQESRGLGDVYKRQLYGNVRIALLPIAVLFIIGGLLLIRVKNEIV